MSTPQDALAAGLNPADATTLDLATAARIKSRISVSDRLLTKEQAGAYQKGEIDVNPALPPPSAPVTTAQPLPPGLVAATPAAPAPVSPTAIPITTGPELRPNDPPRFQQRINEIWRQKSEAEERAESLERRVAELSARLESRFQPTPPVNAYTNQYGSNPGIPSVPSFEASQPQPSPAAPYVTRDELLSVLTQRDAVVAQEAAIYNAHTVSRFEAERRFPDVFQNPEMRQAFDSAWRQDPFLKQDPRGPEKLAASIRGLYYDPAAPLTPPQVPAALRKENLSAIGPSVPEGSAQPDPQVLKFNAAMEHAKRFPTIDNLARALRIARREE